MWAGDYHRRHRRTGRRWAGTRRVGTTTKTETTRALRGRDTAAIFGFVFPRTEASNLTKPQQQCRPCSSRSWVCGIPAKLRGVSRTDAFIVGPHTAQPWIFYPTDTSAGYFFPASNTSSGPTRTRRTFFCNAMDVVLFNIDSMSV